MDNDAFDNSEEKNLNNEHNGISQKLSTIETFAGQANQIGNAILGPALDCSFEPLYFPNIELFNEIRGLYI